MEGRKRASSPISIADERAVHNDKRPETGAFRAVSGVARAGAVASGLTLFEC
jgi:hypothetical protein